MEMCYAEKEILMPMNFVVIKEDEMEYIEGGELTLAAAIGIIGGLIAAGYGVISIGKECGEYVYNNGGSRNGSMMRTFQLAGVTLGGIVGGGLFVIGLDNGWVAASIA